MLLLSMGLMFFQDPLLNYFNTWCTYNAWLFNHGVLGAAHSRAGCHPRNRAPMVRRTAADQHAGIRVRRSADHHRRMLGHAAASSTRWPNISNLRLILATYAIAFVFDFVMEALVLLPIGFYTYPGAIQSRVVQRGHLLPVADLRGA